MQIIMQYTIIIIIIIFSAVVGNWELKSQVECVYKTRSLDGTKPNTNLKTNADPNTNPIQLFYAFFEHRS